MKDEPTPRAPRAAQPAQPALVLPDGVEAEAKAARARNPLPNATLGDTGIAAKVGGADRFGPGMLVIPYNDGALEGLDPATVRLFRAEKRTLVPVWNSGANVAHNQVWGRITRPGTYVAIGLPLDPVVRELIRVAGETRRFADHDEDKAEAARGTLGVLHDIDDADLARVRGAVATAMANTAADPPGPEVIEFGEGGHFAGLRLPGGGLDGFRERVRALDPGPDGLPEEMLFHPPYEIHDDLPPWDLRDLGGMSWSDLVPSLRDRLWDVRHIFDRLPICWLLNRDWWTYHGDERHTGVAHCSSITASNVSTLRLVASVPTDSSVVTIPTIVGGKVYVGSGGDTGIAATLYKIDLATGAVNGTFPVSGDAFYPYNGIGGSPTVTGGRVYFSAVHGKVYCVDAATMTQVWVTDLKHADPAHNQPVSNPNGDCWSSPLVVNGRVYVACGEGEGGSGTYGFAYCLDATNGHVLWLFCTCAFGAGDNAPNVIPASMVGVSPLPAMFSSHANPPQAGASPWSSFAYDAGLNRVYIGTGNSTPDGPMPQPKYASGVLSLDATTGAFRGFFEPLQTDNYRPGDVDVDIPASPMIYDRGDRRVLAIGSKNGSFFLLDPDTMAVLERRQLLPKTTAGDIIPSVASGSFGGFDAIGENKWGVMATAAVHAGLGKVYVGLGGYSGIGDQTVTPFIRALDWHSLADAWPTAVDTVNGRQVVRYTAARPPLYTSGEAGLASPAVSNDVVFMSTHKTALYALDAATGTCLWSAPGMPSGGWPTYCLGPAVSGKYVVVGAAHEVRIYALTTPHRFPRIPDLVEWPPRPRGWPWDLPWPPRPPHPGPDPDPWGPLIERPDVEVLIEPEVEQPAVPQVLPRRIR